jgi:hypothetical protein
MRQDKEIPERTYTGASAELSLAAGLGANVLVCGSSQAVALQPLSVQGQIGLTLRLALDPWTSTRRGDADRP